MRKSREKSIEIRTEWNKSAVYINLLPEYPAILSSRVRNLFDASKFGGLEIHL